MDVFNKGTIGKGDAQCGIPQGKAGQRAKGLDRRGDLTMVTSQEIMEELY